MVFYLTLGKKRNRYISFTSLNRREFEVQAKAVQIEGDFENK